LEIDIGLVVGVIWNYTEGSKMKFGNSTIYFC
jgi:hypothetical protein